mmetsp:Transcript_17827/g.52042  ORF Transcript_17827/g.52042 Transcript_17827/m.52042 type:complete len:124 (-) Transcript_17827:325-696(-)
MSLRDFIQRAAARAQYRSLMRAALQLRRRDPDMADEVVVQVRSEFDTQRTAIDRLQIRQAMAHGRRQLELLKSLGATTSKETPNGVEDEQAQPPETQGPVIWPWQQQETTTTTKAAKSNKHGR